MRRLMIAIRALLLIGFVCPCFAQDVLARHRVNGLKNLGTVAIVLRENSQREVATPREFGDWVELGLHRNIPELTVAEPEKAPAWLELNILSSDGGCAIELSLYRWVKLKDTGEDIVSKVWWDGRALFGEVPKKAVRESVEGLVAAFSADYVRAKR